MPGKTHRALRNSAIQGISQVLTWGFSWVLLVMLPRYLGDEGFGQLFLALSYALVFGTLLNMGINKYLVKQVAILNPIDDPDVDEEARNAELRAMLGNVFSLKILMSVGFYLLLVGLVSLLPYDSLTRTAILIVCLSACINNLTQTSSGVFQGFENMLPPNLALVAEKMLTTAGCAVLLISGYRLIPVCFVYLGAAVVNCALTFVLLRRRIKFPLSWNFAGMKELLAGGLPFLIWIVFGEIYVRVDVLMLSFMTGASVVGWYGAAFRIYATLLFVPHMLNNVVFPPLARMGAEDEKAADFALASRRVMNLLLSVVVPIGAGVAIVSAPLILLMYGEGPFEHSIWSLRIFSACIVVVSVDVVLGSVLIARGRQKQWSYMAIAAAVFNPLMNAWMIPLTQSMWQNGGIGAALATLLTEGLMMAGALWLMPEKVFSTRNLKTAAKAAFCALLMMLVLHLTGIGNLLVIVPLGALLYGILAVALRVLPPEDIHHLLHAAGLEDRAPALQRLLGIRNP